MTRAKTVAARATMAAALALVVAGTTVSSAVAAGGKPGVRYEHCANGSAAAPITCDTAKAAQGYTRGGLNATKSSYVEGDFVPARLVASNLTPGHGYSVTIGYDTTRGGSHAFDYLGGYDATESVGNNPCVGVTGCLVDSTQWSFPVPVDPTVTAGQDGTLGTVDDIVQVPGRFSAFGGTLNGVSGYSTTGEATGDSSRRIMLSFTANQPNVVIAYGLHLARSVDWGVAAGSSTVSGALQHYVVSFSGGSSGKSSLSVSPPPAL